jgi:hypothetical protein
MAIACRNLVAPNGDPAFADLYRNGPFAPTRMQMVNQANTEIWKNNRIGLDFNVTQANGAAVANDGNVYPYLGNETVFQGANFGWSVSDDVNIVHNRTVQSSAALGWFNQFEVQLTPTVPDPRHHTIFLRAAMQADDFKDKSTRCLGQNQINAIGDWTDEPIDDALRRRPKTITITTIITETKPNGDTTTTVTTTTRKVAESPLWRPSEPLPLPVSPSPPIESSAATPTPTAAASSDTKVVPIETKHEVKSITRPISKDDVLNELEKKAGIQALTSRPSIEPTSMTENTIMI